MHALDAYQHGATGAGVLIGVVDSGIDLTSPEFTGRILVSQDVAGSRTAQDANGHGTAVAFIAAGRRNGVGTSGVAFDASLGVFRADTPGSCGTDPMTAQACQFSTDAIANGVDAARLAGARVINLSLETSSLPQTVIDAIDRATASGVVVVVAAGNDGAANPGSLAAVAEGSAARNQVIVAGSVNSADAIGATSNRAGSGIAHYLAAVGEQVRAPDQNDNPYQWSGTSFAAPQISGAVALLAQAFPSLTGAQIVEILLRTARDAGAAGADTTYGQGVLDLTRAFQPVGTLSVAGMRSALSLDSIGSMSPPMGDARQGALGTLVLDDYSRAYTMSLAGGCAPSAPLRVLASLAAPATRQIGFATETTMVALNMTSRASAPSTTASRFEPAPAGIAGRVVGIVEQRLGDTSVALGLSQGAPALTAQLAGRSAPAFLLGEQGAGLGFDARAVSSVGVRQHVHGSDLTLVAESGNVMFERRPTLAGADRQARAPYQRAQASLDHRFGALATTLSATWLDERATVLGSRLVAGLGAPGAQSVLLDGAARVAWGEGWSLGGSWRRGWTQADFASDIKGSGSLRVAAFSADVSKDGVVGNDSIGLRVAQPMRVASGGLDMVLPSGWDYATQQVSTWSTQRLNLAPAGRELDVEARYARQLPWGAVQGNLFWRRDPGNVAAADDDVGIALRWSAGF